MLYQLSYFRNTNILKSYDYNLTIAGAKVREIFNSANFFEFFLRNCAVLVLFLNFANCAQLLFSLLFLSILELLAYRLLVYCAEDIVDKLL